MSSVGCPVWSRVSAPQPLQKEFTAGSYSLGGLWSPGGCGGCSFAHGRRVAVSARRLRVGGLMTFVSRHSLSFITDHRVEWTYLLVFCFPLIISSGMGGKWKQLFIGEIYELHLAAWFPQLPQPPREWRWLFTSPEVLIGPCNTCLWPADFPTLLPLGLQGALWEGAHMSSFGVVR